MAGEQTDYAAPILAGDTTLAPAEKEQLWDVFNGSKDPAELEKNLASFVIPDDTKSRLLDAHTMLTQDRQNALAAAPAPAEDPVSRTKQAINTMAGMDQAALDLAEAHPNVLKALTVATPKEKAPSEPVGASKPAGQGKQASASEKPAPLAQPPRRDGLQHMPPIPDKHYRVQTSDGGIWDIPAEHIEHARALDPDLHVMNP